MGWFGTQPYLHFMAGTLAEIVMIRNLRRQGPWPANSYARFLWLAIGLWEGILALADVYRSSSDDETRLVLAFHVLGDFDSLDELLREFHNHIKREELCSGVAQTCVSCSARRL